ncbi:284_t:CDS:2, partial [Scutellospora calospora]
MIFGTELAYFRRQGSNTTNSIKNLKIKEEMQWEDSYDFMNLDIDNMNILSSNDMIKAFKQLQEKIIKIQEDVLLFFSFKTRAKGLPNLNATIKFINAIL